MDNFNLSVRKIENGFIVAISGSKPSEYSEYDAEYFQKEIYVEHKASIPSVVATQFA